MSARPRLGRFAFALALTGVIPLLTGCPKKETPVVDAGPPPPPEEASTSLVPMEEDAGAADADADAPAKKWTGPAVNPNVQKLKACCAALGNQGKQNAASPEGQMIINAAAQCNTAAGHLGPNGTAPELAVVRGLMQGKTIPPICAGLF